jgi:hypothetical protein
VTEINIFLLFGGELNNGHNDPLPSEEKERSGTSDKVCFPKTFTLGSNTT